MGTLEGMALLCWADPKELLQCEPHLKKYGLPWH
jgi:hypothetical protein